MSAISQDTIDAGSGQPIEVHQPLADDKLVLWPSQRRPLRRDLARLVARFQREPVHRHAEEWRP